VVARIRVTDRERQVIELVLEGLSYREVGSRLGIREKTVNAHVQAVASRLPGNGRPITRIVRHADKILGA